MKTVGLLIAIILMGAVAISLSPFVFMLTLMSEWAEKKPLAPYCKVVAVGIDQMLGSVMYKTEDWTISAYTHWLASKGQTGAIIFEKIIDFFAYPFQKNHCETAYKREFEELGMNPDEYYKKSKEIERRYK